MSEQLRFKPKEKGRAEPTPRDIPMCVVLAGRTITHKDSGTENKDAQNCVQGDQE
jgi:hypothetical protein